MMLGGKRTLDVYVAWPVARHVGDLPAAALVETGGVDGAGAHRGGVEVVKPRGERWELARRRSLRGGTPLSSGQGSIAGRRARPLGVCRTIRICSFPFGSVCGLGMLHCAV